MHERATDRRNIKVKPVGAISRALTATQSHQSLLQFGVPGESPISFGYPT